jgi:hypothetical protein
MYEIWANYRGKEKDGYHEAMKTTTLEIAQRHIEQDIEGMGFIKQTAFVMQEGWNPVPGWDGVLYRYGDSPEKVAERRQIAMAARQAVDEKAEDQIYDPSRYARHALPKDEKDRGMSR